jgi:CO/xanthine dehydrogenase Mo-binding subunit
LKQSDTAHGGHDTGAYGSAGIFVAGRATQAASETLAADIMAFASEAAGSDRDTCVLEQESVTCGKQRLSFAEIARSARQQGKTLAASGNSSGTPRSVAFNVQGFRVAVNKATGEIKILKSVQAADAGRLANPMQCRGQVEGGVAQSLGATLYEEMVIDAGGRVANPSFRDYHLPTLADVPRTEVYFADTSDTLGPMGAKSMSESPYNPVAAALGNALADATGIRFTSVPFKPDRLFPLLHEKFGKAD